MKEHTKRISDRITADAKPESIDLPDKWAEMSDAEYKSWVDGFIENMKKVTTG